MSASAAERPAGSAWNYRVMRHVERVADNDETFYAIHEVYYDGDRVAGWTSDPCGSPTGETMDEMSRDLAWIIAGLAKPILDYATGLEVESAAILADDLAKMIRDGAIPNDPPAGTGGGR